MKRRTLVLCSFLKFECPHRNEGGELETSIRDPICQRNIEQATAPYQYSWGLMCSGILHLVGYKVCVVFKKRKKTSAVCALGITQHPSASGTVLKHTDVSTI